MTDSSRIKSNGEKYEKDVLRNKLDTIKLPIDKPDTKKAPETYDKHYLPVLEELGVKTRADIDKLREAVDDKIVQMSDELRMQTLQDLMSGKIKDITQVPLYRDGNLSGIFRITLHRGLASSLG